MSQSNLKNYLLIRTTFANAESRVLLDGDGLSFWPFDVYMKWLHDQGVARNTRIGYATDVAYFLDYIAEVAHAVADGELNTELGFLQNVIRIWPTFSLLSPEQRKSSIERLIAVLGRRLDHPAISVSSLARRLAAIRGFIDLSDRFQQGLDDRRRYDLLGESGESIDECMWGTISKRRELTLSERRRLLRNSMFAGVVSGGPKLSSEKNLRISKRGTARQSKPNLFEVDPLIKAFPYDRIIELIDSAPSYRDKTYLSLLAASGARGHEIRQVLWGDINPITREVFLVPPWGRRFKEIWQAIPIQKQEDIAWKGRETTITYLLEPFKSIFFENLELYRSSPKEWSHTVDHPFVFCEERRYRYRPLILASPSSIAAIFTKTMKKLTGLPHTDYGGHSLRHAYGFFLANVIKLNNGDHGMGLNYVRDLMGHASIASTQIYAVSDQKKIMELFVHANEQILPNIVNMMRVSSAIERYRVNVPYWERDKLIDKEE